MRLVVKVERLEGWKRIKAVESAVESFGFWVAVPVPRKTARDTPENRNGIPTTT